MMYQEKENRRNAVLASILVHGVLLLLLFFAIAWRAPNPPLPQYGIEINFGTSDVGSGVVQPETTPTTTDTEMKQAEQVQDEVEQSKQEVKQETDTSPTKSDPVE
ncbi:MAG TPA: hypothetical protein PKC24_11685, partial [Cyclobacteriaceae bacterium]|nr:hypothetical protein [Cyclobacteriaceae bacterium]